MTKSTKTDLDEVRDIRHKRYLKRNKEYNERIKTNNGNKISYNSIQERSEFV